MGQNLQNKGHSGSRYIIYIYIMFAGNEHSELPAISNSWLSGVWPIPICSPKKVGRLIPHLFTGWWLIYPIEKYEFVSWDYYSQYMESHKIHVPNHQAVHQPVHLVHYPCVVIHPILKKKSAEFQKICAQNPSMVNPCWHQLVKSRFESPSGSATWAMNNAPRAQAWAKVIPR